MNERDLRRGGKRRLRKVTTTTADERIARAEQLRQQTLPSVEFSQRQCLICGEGAEPISSTELPEIMKRLRGELAYPSLVEAARRAGFGPDHCYTSLTGISICKTERPR